MMHGQKNIKLMSSSSLIVIEDCNLFLEMGE